MATLEEIIINNCPMPNIVCKARRLILQRLREVHDSIIYIKAMPHISTRRLICDYIGDDIEAMAIKICQLQREVRADDIQTPELERFIICYLSDITSRDLFDDPYYKKHYSPAYFHPGR